MKLSYLITTKNEVDTLIRLLERVVNFSYDEDEIIILDDYSDKEITCQIINQCVKENKNVFLHRHELKNDYGFHKNYGIQKCSGDWIFQCDADELPSETLIFNIREIIETNSNMELIYVPRINDFKGVTEEHSKKWGWKLTHSPSYENRPIVNWPDFQGRIFKNDYPRIHWERKLHEKIEGHKEYAFLPSDEDLSLYHDKTIETQIQTNLRYNEQFTVQDNLGHKVS